MFRSCVRSAGTALLALALVSSPLRAEESVGAGASEGNEEAAESEPEASEEAADADASEPEGAGTDSAEPERADAEAAVEPSEQHGRPAKDDGQFYDAIDAATVRVFSVGTVDVERVEVEGGEIPVALPRAGHGTGFAVGEDGLVMTAQHIVDEARHVVVRLPGEGGFFAARVAYADDETDIAILEIDAELPTLEILPETPLRVRQTVFALGYPLDASRVHAQSARGIVAGQYDEDTLQLDMALNPGNSGGPLLDEDDRVVGMVVARGDVELGVQGMGFAVNNSALASATREAERRLAAGQVPELDRKARVAAVVVDELIQEGALHELRDVADLEEGLQGAALDRSLHDLTSRTDDSDLLAFMAGVLWNAALAIEVAGARELGEATLSEREAADLAERLRTSSIDAAERAARADPSVKKRSGFVAVAVKEKGLAPRRSVSGSAVVDLGARITPELRLNPGSTLGTGAGVGFGFSMTLRSLASDGRVSFMPVLGAAFGGIDLRPPSGPESYSHAFLSAEVGVKAELGRHDHHLEAVATYAPSRYSSALFSGGEEVARATEAVWMHVRLAAGYRFRSFYIGAGARMLSGPTFWLEPLVLGYVKSY